MEQYILKAPVVAEIKRRIKFVEKRLERNNSYSEEGNAAWERDKALYDAYNSLLSSIDTLEVKKVDFGALGVLANHLIACEAHGITPKYRDEELDFLEGLVEHKD